MRSLLFRVLARCFYSWPISEFENRTRNTAKSQERVLLDNVMLNKDSEYGRDHHFNEIGNIADFQQRVPISSYDYVKPYIDKVMDGEVSALFNPKEDPIAFHMSSGTTASPKYIPVTKTFFKLQSQSWFYWYGYVYRDHPGILHGKILPFYSRAREKITPSGVPCGADTGIIAERQNNALRPLYAVPRFCYQVNDLDAKYYAIMRFAIEQPISFLICANPTVILGFVQSIDENREGIVKEVRDGTFGTLGHNLPKESVEQAEAVLKPSPKRAKELEDIVNRTGRLLPKDFWQSLALIACWRGGTQFLALDLFPDYFGDTPLREIGLSGSEGRYSISVNDDDHGGVLSVSNIFYEFIPEDQEGEENPDTLLAHELEVGKRYYMVITTFAGLYRYNLEDLIVVEDFYNTAPILRFLNKAKHIASLGGVRLLEKEVVEAVRETMRKFNVYIKYCTLVPVTSEPQHFSLLIESSDLPGYSDKQGQHESKEMRNLEECKRFAQEMDKSLGNFNSDYAEKRAAGDLAHLSLKIVEPGIFDKRKRQAIKERGLRLVEQYKHPYAIKYPEYINQFNVIEEIFV